MMILPFQALLNIKGKWQGKMCNERWLVCSNRPKCKKGIGTLAYQDSWNLFDQIIISYPWLNKNQTGFFYQPHIFNREYMTENVGRYKGYPMRTWDGNSYRGGYSDHFPTYIVFLKKFTANVLAWQ